MLTRLSILLGLAFLISVPARAQGGIELFGGYSYQRLGSSPSRNLNGMEASGKVSVLPFVGVVADVDAHFGSPSGVDTRTLHFMVGPQLSFPTRISPFVHLLAGIGHIRTGGIADTSFATAIGGGIDMRVAPFVSWRIIQVDDVFTRFFSGTQNSARISTGVVLRF